MKKNKILLVCALALGLPSAVSSLMHSVEPIIARAASTTTAKVSSGTKINAGWKVSDSTKLSNASGYFKMYGGAYIENEDYIIIDCSSNITFTINVRKFGGPSPEQCKINLDVLNEKNEKIGETVSFSPTTNDNKPYTNSFKVSDIYSQNKYYKVKFRISSSNSATSGKTAGFYSINISYTKGEITNDYHNVIFNSNGGTEYDNLIVKENDTFDVSSYIPVKDKCVFLGWYADSMFDENSKLTTGTMGTEDINLYAKWRDEKVFDKFVDVKTNTNLKFNYTKSNSNLVTESIDFTKQNYSTGQTISSYNGDNYDVKFNNNSNPNSPKYYSSGTAIRVYNDNSLTISSTNQNIKNIKLVLSEKYSDGVSKLILSSGVANTSEENIILIQNTNGLSITIKNSGSSQLRIQQIIINEQTVTYSNFNNLQIQYQYSFDVSSYTEVQEVGIFVTDDEKFEFYNDGFYNDEMTFEESLSTNTKGHRFVNSNKKETYTVGVNLGDDIGSAVLTTFRACAYVKTNDNKYYFSKNISKYNLQTMLEEYSKLTLEGEGNAIVDSFLSYVNSL